MSSNLALLLLFAFVSCALCDVYMHNPRGSNDRLNGNGRNRANANRLFDSQNNDKGGYCWGPPMHFFVGSHLMIEWTNQHACNQPKVYCQIVLQYMCNNELRDGATTDTIPDNENTYNTLVNPDPLGDDDEGRGETYLYGMHESYQYYQDCKTRERNKGLFTADQNMNNRNSARHTRQDNNGQRNGFECPEERDYYPYWHPTPWKDIAILVNTEELNYCDFFKSNSQNVMDKGYCSDMAHNNERECTLAGAKWREHDAWGIDPPECKEAPWSRQNHLGNTLGGYASSYNWTIPDDVHESCALRLRYNISTGDYQGHHDEDGEFIDHRFNRQKSPIKQDEITEYYGKPYEMALNTDQLGRTFQDRSHLFSIRERPDFIPDSAKIWNLNVRGKRGNIVQVYPAVEYDFVPNRLHAKIGDYIHFQWTGCDTNPANNDGEGTQQTDRSNMAQMYHVNENYPYEHYWGKPDEPMFQDDDLMHDMAFLDQENCLTYEALRAKNNNNNNAIEQDEQNCMKLNAADRYWNGGVHRVNKTGLYHYFSTRNNNFSNRGQKATIMVDDLLPTWSLVLITAGSSLFVVSGAVAGILMYAKAGAVAAV